MSGAGDGVLIGALAGGAVGAASTAATTLPGGVTIPFGESVFLGTVVGTVLGGVLGAVGGVAVEKKLTAYREERDQCLEARFP